MEIELKTSVDSGGMDITDSRGNKKHIPVVFSSPPVGFKKVINIYIEPASGKLVVIHEA